MKSRPILFSAPMVQAILQGRKTQTRRLVKPQPPENFSNFGSKIAYVSDITLNYTIYCPYGKPGDILWVREKWTENGLGYYRYGADWPKGEGPFVGTSVPAKFRGKWKPGIHMPKAACRLFLELVSVTVEKLNDISEQDSISEGVSRYPKSPIYGYKNYIDESNFCLNATDSFQTLWQKINGVQSWNDNPWVWVVEFKLVDKPDNFLTA